jgi:hypothetical protein
VTDDLDTVVAELEALERFLGPKLQWQMPWTPHERQQEFLALTCREALYGGAAMGGKTAALLMAAAQYIHVPGYSALILRRTHGELLGADGPIEQAKRLFDDLLGSGEMTWVKSEMTLRTNWGSSIKFGHMATEDDFLQYQGQAFQFVGYDELTHFKEHMYTYLFSRLRGGGGLGSNVPLRIRGATNPGGIGHDWVGKRFAIREDGSQDIEATRNPETDELRPFITARLADNAANADINEYRKSLSNLDTMRRNQLEHGRWIRDGEGLVYKFNRKRNLIPAFDRSAGPWRYVASVDLGTSQSKPTTAIGISAYHEHKNLVVHIQSEARAGMIPSTIADRLAELRADYEIDTIVVDEGGLGRGYTGEFNLRFGEIAIGASKRDKLGFRSLMNGALEQGQLLIVGWVDDGDNVGGPNKGLVGELESLCWDERGLDVSKGAADHLTDQLLYGWRYCYGFAAESPENRPAPGTPEWALEEERRMEEAASEDEWDDERPWYEGGVE